MNVIVANQYKNELSNLDVDVIKSITGEFDADELVAMFKNFFFDKMILDITAIKNYKNLEVIQKLAMGLSAEKLILIIPDEECSSSAYLSSIISMGIYNFTNNVNAVKQLIDNPNSYKDVAKIQQLNASSIASSEEHSGGKKIIGVKNVTEHAGATTLIYMMKKELNNIYGNSVCALEVNRRDFSYLNEKNMFSIGEGELNERVKSLNNCSVIFIDLNDCQDTSVCTDIIYLMEPSTLQLNKMIRKNRKVFEKLNGKKIILNKSMLNNKDVGDFEYESNSKIFYNLPALDERKKNDSVNDLLFRLGLLSDTASKKAEGNKIFGIFKI